MDEKREKRCNFCGKPEHMVEGMISAADVNICSECVTYCYEMLYGPVDPAASAKEKKKKSKAGRDPSAETGRDQENAGRICGRTGSGKDHPVRVRL